MEEACLIRQGNIIKNLLKSIRPTETHFLAKVNWGTKECQSFSSFSKPGFLLNSLISERK